MHNFCCVHIIDSNRLITPALMSDTTALLPENPDEHVEISHQSVSNNHSPSHLLRRIAPGLFLGYGSYYSSTIPGHIINARCWVLGRWWPIWTSPTSIRVIPLPVSYHFHCMLLRANVYAISGSEFHALDRVVWLVLVHEIMHTISHPVVWL